MSLERGIFERRFPNRVGDLGRVTEAAVRFLEKHGAGNQAVYAAHLSIEELVTNIIKYGYDDTASHEILLRLEVCPRIILLRLEDDGHEFNPLAAPTPDVDLPVAQRVPGGLGIHLVRNMVGEIQYQRSGGRNRLTITIRTS